MFSIGVWGFSSTGYLLCPRELYLAIHADRGDESHVNNNIIPATSSEVAFVCSLISTIIVPENHSGGDVSMASGVQLAMTLLRGAKAWLEL